MNKPEIKHGLEIKFGTTYGPEEFDVLRTVLENNAPSCGQEVMAFQDAFAEYCGVPYALAVTSATTGLSLAGVAAGVGPGDEVITSPISWIATATAFSELGASVRFCDVDPLSLNMDPQHLEKLITTRTRAIVPVHLFGRSCPMDEIMTIAGKHGITVIDDCAHAPGAFYRGRKVGSLADLSVFSFQQQKNMSTLGEGGMVTTSSKDLRDRVLSYRSLCCRIYGGSNKYLAIDESEHPMGKKYWHLEFDDIGFNYRMTDAQAAVGIVQLRKLDANNRRRHELFGRLNDSLADVPGLVLPTEDPEGRSAHHLYMIQLNPDFPLSKIDFMWELYTQYGIKAWSNYIPIHLTKPYVDRGHGMGECPVAEAAVERHVILPFYPHMTDEALDYMVNAVRELGDL